MNFNDIDFKNGMAARIEEIETVIKSFLPKEKGYQKTVIEAMNYSVLAGGKRLRPMLLWETYRMFGGDGEEVNPFLAALEMIHTYSLVHDDLPCMDDDEYRRGRKTTHAVYGEGMAVLAGDALLNYAFETAISALSKAKDAGEMEKVSKALAILSGKAGIYGMIGGQNADIEAEDKGAVVSEEQLLFIYGYKTAALIQCAMMIGAVLADAGEEQIKKIENCAYNIGVAFQIQDDILDITGSLEALGKQTGSDEKNHKATYVSLKGIEEAKKEVERLSKEAMDILGSFAERNEFLEALVEQLITRER